MKIVDKRKLSQRPLQFKDLCVGDCFLDQDGDVSIKTYVNKYIVAMDGGKYWGICEAEETEKVIPLDVTLTINGEK